MINAFTPIEVVKDLACRPQVPPWPKGFRQWENIRRAHLELLHEAMTVPVQELGSGRGIVMPVGPRHYACACVVLTRLRELGCGLPLQVWTLGRHELDTEMEDELRSRYPGLKIVHYPGVGRRVMNGWELKVSALIECGWREVFLLDADFCPTRNLEGLELPATGAAFLPDYPHWELKWELVGLEAPEQESWPVERVKESFGREIPTGWIQTVESGLVLVDRVRHAGPLHLARHMCDHADYWCHSSEAFHGDKDMLFAAWKLLKSPYTMGPRWPGYNTCRMVQFWLDGKVIGYHSTQDKDWTRTTTLPGDDHLVQLSKAVKRRVPWSRSDECAGVYECLHRGCHGYKLEIHPNGTCSNGMRWTLGGDQLVFMDGKGVAAAFRKSDLWRGRWIRDEHAPAVLIPWVEPIAQPLGDAAGTYERRLFSRPDHEESKGVRVFGEVELLPNGTVRGGLPQEKRWERHGSVLTILGDGPTCHLTRKRGDGTWRGRWLVDHQAPVEMKPC